MWHNMYHEGHFGGMHWMWWSILVIVVIGIFFGLSILRPGKSGDSAMDELRRRYARGEIDKKEFDERRSVLKEK